MSRRAGALLPGLVLVLLGAWLLARNLNLPVPGMDALWPGFVLLFGLGMLVRYWFVDRTEHGLVFVGTAGTLLGLFFFAITLGPLDWGDLGRYWPVFVLIGGAAFTAQWLAQPAERALLVPAGGALLVGLAALYFTLGRASAAVRAALGQLWPLALIVAGLALLARYLLRPDRDR